MSFSKVLTDKIQVFLAHRKNRKAYKNNLIPKFEFELREQFLNTVEQFGKTDFYQNYPPLKISGLRSSVCRFNTYELSNYFTNNTSVLDIGGNIGFFSAYLSRFVKEIDLVEQNTKLTSIGKKLAEFEKIKNLNIVNQDFKLFETDKKYDFIMSLAIHMWVNLPFQQYLKKIHSLLKLEGILLFESHILFSGKNIEIDLEAEITKSNLFSVIKIGQIDDHEGYMRDFYILKAI